jgi:methylated-DNA-[protein]-cysteine S-methyltransferase
MFHTYIDSPLGRLVLMSDGTALTGLYIIDQSEITDERLGKQSDDAAPFPAARKQLNEYFAGERREFDVPLNMNGTDFQKTSWSELLKIPYGTTITYGELARRVGNAKATRAVGMANNRNPISIIIPCHRVIGADGALTGYGGGLHNKRKLLDLENSRALVLAGRDR